MGYGSGVDDADQMQNKIGIESICISLVKVRHFISLFLIWHFATQYCDCHLLMSDYLFHEYTMKLCEMVVKGQGR